MCDERKREGERERERERIEEGKIKRFEQFFAVQIGNNTSMTMRVTKT